MSVRSRILLQYYDMAGPASRIAQTKRRAVCSMEPTYLPTSYDLHVNYERRPGCKVTQEGPMGLTLALLGYTDSCVAVYSIVSLCGVTKGLANSLALVNTTRGALRYRIDESVTDRKPTSVEAR